jgi:hypothetical protein
MRRTIITITAAVTVAAASAATAWAIAPQHPASASASAVRTPSLLRTAHVMRGYPTGPSATYSGDTGAIGLVAPISFRLPAQADSYTATVTLSFQYRTTGHGHFYVAPDFRSGGRSRHVAAPTRRYLAASSQRTSATLVFKAGLRSGVTYSLGVGANVQRTNPQPVSITTRSLVVEVEAWPVG